MGGFDVNNAPPNFDKEKGVWEVSSQDERSLEAMKNRAHKNFYDSSDEEVRPIRRRKEKSENRKAVQVWLTPRDQPGPEFNKITKFLKNLNWDKRILNPQNF